MIPSNKILQASFHDPIIHQYITMFQRGNFSYTEALEKCVLHLSKDREFFFDKYMQRINSQPTNSDMVNTEQEQA